jgi:spermidine/putrescine transport system ATP-binding protein
MSQRVPELELEGVTKRFGGTTAVDGVSLRLWPGEFLSLLGPSGCGKTTTLRMIAGFVLPDAGRVLYRGQEITYEPPYRRDVGLVFQSYALFPHMTVAENVAFGLKMRGASKAVIRDRVRWALDLVRLPQYGDRRPAQLSGGQQQRVAVARVLAAGASLLLFDEPFSNLDARLRKAMQVELRELQQRLGIAAIHVTHDQQEAMVVSDRLIVMNGGRIEQEGYPEEVYQQPRSAFVAEFMGDCNRLAATVTGVDRTSGTVFLDLDAGGRLQARWREAGDPPRRAAVFLRPEHITVAEAGVCDPGTNVLRGTVRRRVYLGSITVLHVALNEETDVMVQCLSPLDGAAHYAPETAVGLRVAPSSVRLIPLGGQAEPGEA